MTSNLQTSYHFKLDFQKVIPISLILISTCTSETVFINFSLRVRNDTINKTRNIYASENKEIIGSEMPFRLQLNAKPLSDNHWGHKWFFLGIKSFSLPDAILVENKL